MRCPVSWTITSATGNRQSIPREAWSRASYTASVRRTWDGLFSDGALRPRSRFDSRKNSPSSFPRFCGPVEDREQQLQVLLDGPVGRRIAAPPGPAHEPPSDESTPISLGECVASSAFPDGPDDCVPTHRHSEPI